MKDDINNDYSSYDDNYMHENITHYSEISDLIKDKVDNVEKLTLIYLNARSMRNKLDDIELWLSTFRYDIHILLVTETWLKAGEIASLPKYNSFHSCREFGYGGCSLFIRDNISAALIFCYYEDYCNYLVIKLFKDNIHVIVIYRSQKNSLQSFFYNLEILLSKYTKCLIIGDINLNLLDINMDNITYCDLIHSYGFCILNKLDINFATRNSNTISTIIDHII